MKHKHAELMAQYAQDAMETDKPWERWEARGQSCKDWIELWMNPSWSETVEYRRKPRTININGFEVPEPERKALDHSEDYFIPHPVVYDGTLEFTWVGHERENVLLSRGLVHLTREAAKIHANALFSFTEAK